MSETGDLAAFLAARYDEAEALAETAASKQGETWHPVQVLASELAYIVDGDGEPVCANTTWDLARHIAAHDPAHRLADITLKRAILALHFRTAAVDVGWACARCSDYAGGSMTAGEPWPCATVRHLGTEFAGHAEYDGSWAP